MFAFETPFEFTKIASDTYQTVHGFVNIFESFNAGFCEHMRHRAPDTIMIIRLKYL